jgi:hypothetical protein
MVRPIESIDSSAGRVHDPKMLDLNMLPPARKVVTVPGEVIWTITVDRVEWSCESRFHGETYGWDVRLLRENEFFASHRFPLREQAERWAVEQRHDIERGWGGLGADLQSRGKTAAPLRLVKL